MEKNPVSHPWHDLHPGTLDEVRAFIEVPKNSMLKYELDKESGHIILDRVLYSAVHYPGDYGFIPQTLSEDGDPIDIIILSNFPVHPGVIVKARPIGVLEMVDDNEKDEKIIAVHSSDPRFERYHDMRDVSEHILLEIRNFFETYKQLQGQEVKILSVKSVEDAKHAIEKALYDYKRTFIDTK